MASSKANAGSQKAHAAARKAEAAFAKGQIAKALPYAEQAVEQDLANREYRDLLARIYMADGRFKSAERTLMDVMELGQVDPRTVVSLALTRIAQGRVESAIALIEANRSIVPASDYGLTLALAGQSGRAVDILTDAIRTDSASARTRQNLALAYALDGRWRESRIMAVQDMSQDQVNLRIAEWAQYARPGAYEARVAGLLKVTPQADAGQPVRLALANVTNNLAQVELPVQADVVVASIDPNQELAAVGPAPASQSAGFLAADEDVRVAIAPVTAPTPLFEAPLIAAAKGPTKTASVPEIISKPVMAPEKPVKFALAIVEPEPSSARQVGGTHLVQLGAFSTAANAKRAWSKFSERYGILSGFSSASSTVNVNGKTLTRVAASGFGNKAAADAVCKQIKVSGGDCIVRSMSSPVRLASSAGRNVAVR